MRKFVALDIDGVILKGGSVLQGAKSAVAKLQSNKIPFVFMTNGGGVTEQKKADELSKKLGMSIVSKQILLSHSPFKSLSTQFESKQVLILGDKKCLEVAKSYGFNHVITANCIYNKNPLIFPNRKEQLTWNSNYSEAQPIAAVMIFHDPIDWALDMQVLSDILSKESLNIQIPLFVSNADIVYTTEHKLPRFTQGAFIESFRHLYESYHSKKLEITFCGKPFKIQYELAERMLLMEESRINSFKETQSSLSNSVFFGVGDNPLSDVRGANAAGVHWRSVLVRSGVFQGGDNDGTDPAHHVLNNVEDAVDYILGNVCLSNRV